VLQSIAGGYTGQDQSTNQNPFGYSSQDAAANAAALTQQQDWARDYINSLQINSPYNLTGDMWNNFMLGATFGGPGYGYGSNQVNEDLSGSAPDGTNKGYSGNYSRFVTT
jgi:hypothetical protein